MFPPEVEVGLGETQLPPRVPATGAVRRKDPACLVALGGTHSLVLTSSGKVFGFGRLENDRLGVESDPVSGMLRIAWNVCIPRCRFLITGREGGGGGGGGLSLSRYRFCEVR